MRNGLHGDQHHREPGHAAGAWDAGVLSREHGGAASIGRNNGEHQRRAHRGIEWRSQRRLCVSSNGTATAGTDYTAAGGTLNWADGDATAKTISVPIGAVPFNGMRSFTVTLLAPAGGATLGAVSSNAVTITLGLIAPSLVCAVRFLQVETATAD